MAIIFIDSTLNSKATNLNLIKIDISDFSHSRHAAIYENFLSGDIKLNEKHKMFCKNIL